ncbi:MAG: hypothetical protein KY468_01415 [Armatimonadetes bacterium]|nr:hypothetical protein [Armatimonadota bacterium]
MTAKEELLQIVEAMPEEEAAFLLRGMKQRRETHDTYPLIFTLLKND